LGDAAVKAEKYSIIVVASHTLLHHTSQHMAQILPASTIVTVGKTLLNIWFSWDLC
jgi:hypothetical protein